MYKLHRRLVAVAVTLAAVASACGGDDSSSSETTAAPATTAAAATTAAPATTASPATTTAGGGAATTVAGGGTAGSLADVCPADLVLQLDWFPEAEYGVYYSLIGADGELDAAKGSYKGPLLDTGVNLEIRAGGPFIGQQTVQSLMFQDDSINLGLVHTDDAVRFSKQFPVTGVVAPLEHSPLALLWDPEAHDFTSFEDIGASGATILVFTKAVNYVPFLIKKGLVPESSFDDSFDGSYSRFVADNSIVQQAFVTETPYRLENEIAEYAKPVDTILVSESGYDPYLSSLSVKTDALEEMAPCLTKLVPIVQQAQVDYITDPAAANQVMVDVATGMNTFWTLSNDLLTFGNEQMLANDIVSNGTDSTLGNFDDARVQQVIDDFQTTFGTDVDTSNADVTPAAITTNQFIDTSIGL
jgi:hypothetical protein